MCDQHHVVRMVSGLPGDGLRGELSTLTRLEEATGRASAFYLHDMQERGVHQETGHQSAVRYAVDRLDLPLSTAKEMVAVGRLLRELPGCDAAFCSGRIGWSKLRLLARIATPETEKEWIGEAERLTYQKLQLAIAGLAKGDRPRKDKLGLPRVQFALTARVDAVMHARLEWLRESLGVQTDGDLIHRLVDIAEGLTAAEESGRPRTTLVLSHCPS